MWARDWLSPQSWHCGENSFFHLHRLTLWGSVHVRHCIECKLEDPLRKAEDSYEPILGCTAFILPHSQPLYRKAAGVSQSGGCVLSLDLGLDTRQDLLLGGSGILLHHPHHHLVRSERGTLKLGLMKSNLSSDGANTGVTGEHV